MSLRYHCFLFSLLPAGKFYYLRLPVETLVGVAQLLAQVFLIKPTGIPVILNLLKYSKLYFLLEPISNQS